ncbi:hypothetical protein [Azospirillum doebereinerae]
MPVIERHPEAAVAVPPRCDAVLKDTADTTPTQRDRHIQAITETGRMAWQRVSGYNQRAKVEGQIGRWKQVLGPALRFHTDGAQTAEVAIGVVVLNRMLNLGRPNTARFDVPPRGYPEALPPPLRRKSVLAKP